MMSKIALIIVALTFSIVAGAQDRYNSSGKSGKGMSKAHSTKGFDPSRLVYGGNIALGFGTITNIYIAPSIGYRISDKFAAGISLGYNYFRQKNGDYSVNINTQEVKYTAFTQSIYTGGVWARYVIIPNLMVQTEFEANNISYYNYNKPPIVDANGWQRTAKSRMTIPSLLVGGGLRQPIGENASMYIMAMYDVLQNIPSNMRTDANTGERYSISPYARRIDFRIGYTIGF